MFQLPYHHVVIVSDSELSVTEDCPGRFKLHHHNLSPLLGLTCVASVLICHDVTIGLQFIDQVCVSQIGDAGMVDKGHQRVQSPSVNIGDSELETVCEENPDQAPGQLLCDPWHSAGQQGGHPLIGRSHLSIKISLLVVIHKLKEPFEHLRVAGLQETESDWEDDVEHARGVPDLGQGPALLLAVCPGGLADCAEDVTTDRTSGEAAPPGAADHADPAGGGAQQDGRVGQHGLAGPDLPGRHQAPATSGPGAHSERELGRQHRDQAALLPHQLHGQEENIGWCER